MPLTPCSPASDPRFHFARPRDVCVSARAGAYIFRRGGRHVLLRSHGYSVRNQVPDAPQARLHRGAAIAECGWRVRAAPEGVGQYGPAGLGAKHFGSTGVSSGEVRSPGFRSGLQGRRGDANRRMAATVDDGAPEARSRSAGKPIHGWRADGCDQRAAVRPMREKADRPPPPPRPARTPRKPSKSRGSEKPRRPSVWGERTSFQHGLIGSSLLRHPNCPAAQARPRRGT